LKGTGRAAQKFKKGDQVETKNNEDSNRTAVDSQSLPLHYLPQLIHNHLATWLTIIIYLNTGRSRYQRQSSKCYTRI